MAWVAHDLRIQAIDGGAAAFEHLHEYPVAMAQHAGNAVGRIVHPRLLHDGLHHLAQGLVFDGAAGIQKSD